MISISSYWLLNQIDHFSNGYPITVMWGWVHFTECRENLKRQNNIMKKTDYLQIGCEIHTGIYLLREVFVQSVEGRRFVRKELEANVLIRYKRR